jgi:hemoglobin
MPEITAPGAASLTRSRIPSDIVTREDIAALVDRFYERIRADEVLGPIFDDVARVDWAAHLPKMYDFWDSVLFGRAAFKGNPLGAHRALARLTPLARSDFDRWVGLFHRTVDDLFDGPMADEAKFRASRIAMVMHHHVALDRQMDEPRERQASGVADPGLD